MKAAQIPGLSAIYQDGLRDRSTDKRAQLETYAP